jgi:hypothetical protein
VAVTLTDSPALVAGIVVAVTLPWLLFALPAGAPRTWEVAWPSRRWW